MTVKPPRKPLPLPKKGGKPERITTKNPPGGPKTPGAKKALQIKK